MSADKSAAKASRKGMGRRRFLREGAGAAAAWSIVPRSVLGGPRNVPPSDQVTIAAIGVGSQGTRVMMDLLKIPDARVVAVCDVNKESSDYSEWGTNEIRDKERSLLGSAFSTWGSWWKGATCGREPARRLVEAYYGLAKASSDYQGCNAYVDYRELLEQEKDLDAVLVCTVDHWHAPIAIAAMKKGKHVFGQKPMTHSVAEARRMGEVARETKRATQLAVGNAASEDTRRLSEWVAAGAIGPVREVHNWSSRPFWPQGIERPPVSEPVPEGFDWDLWIGPREYRPYNHVYLPFIWRAWYDFGTGCLGDMGNYSFDTIFRVLKIGAPIAVEASSTPLFKESYPLASLVHYYFPARGDMPPVTIHWYDGSLRPPRPLELEPGREMSRENEGMLLLGDNGKILCGFDGDHPQLIPEAKMKDFKEPAKTLPRSPGLYREWLDACKGGAPAAANFEFESTVDEALLLGNIAVRAGKKLEWDSAALKITNDAEAGKLVEDSYREGYGI